jgi:hypothetical protein
MLEGLSGIAAPAHGELSAATRERALSNALSASVSAPLPRTAPSRRAGLMLGAAAALALGVVVAQLGSREPSNRVLSGEVIVAGSALAAGEALSSHVQLHTTEAAVVALGHARVELRAGSDASWDGQARTLDLQRGSALIDVDPAQHRSFQVVTRAFGVVVLGTRFEVTESAVQVLLGRVAVQLKAAGTPVVLAAGSARTRFELQPAAASGDTEPQPSATGGDSAPGADSSRTRNEPQPSAAGPDAAPSVLAADARRTRNEPQPSATDAAPDALAAGSDRKHNEPQPLAARADGAHAAFAADSNPPLPAAARPRGARGVTQPGAAARDASALLDLARSQLAARELAQARATLELAAPHLHDAALRAQALSLEAECELQARRFDVARDTYLQVARRFSKMPAAETALFAAARIEAEHGEQARARKLLSSYLAKYPRGSFVREAERRLQLLPRGAASEPVP